MVRTTIEHALGGISRRWEILKQFDGEKYVPSERHDFKSAYFYAKQTCSFHVQSTPDNSNLQGKLKKVRVIGS